MANAPSKEHMRTAEAFVDAEAPKGRSEAARMPKGLSYDNLLTFASTPAGKAMIDGMRRKAKGK